jgi:hypothetical protein
MVGGSSGCGLSPWSCSGKVGACVNIISRACPHTYTVIDCDDFETLMNIEVSIMHLARYIAMAYNIIPL